MNDNRCGTRIKKLREPFRKSVVVKTNTSFNRNGQTSPAFFRSFNQSFCQFRIVDERSACPLLKDVFIRTAHINIDAVKAQLCCKPRSLFHLFGFCAKKLRYDRALGFSEPKIVNDLFASARSKSLGRDKFRVHEVRFAILGDHTPKGGIGHICHRREYKNRFFEFLPEIHRSAAQGFKSIKSAVLRIKCSKFLRHSYSLSRRFTKF